VLSILDKQTGRILRTVSMPQDHQSMGNFSNIYPARALDKVDLDHDGIDEIVVSYAHSPLWPSYATYYDPLADNVRTILRASGHHVAAGTADFDGDGLDEVLFYGINNRMGSYNTLAVVSVHGERLIAAADVSYASGDSGVVASTPDAEYFRSTVDAMLWYTLLPSPYRQFGQPLIDTSLRRITIEHPGQEPTIIDFDGFLAGTVSALPPAERQQARRAAYKALRSGIRMLESDRGDAALEQLTEAAQHARAAADPILAEWIARNELRALIRAQRVSEAERRLEALIPSASSPGDVAWDAAHEMHLEGLLEQAVRLYLRGLGLNPNIDQGRKKYEYLEGAILALGELGRWDEARQAVRQFEAAYPEQISFYAGDFHAYIDWRSTGRISPGPVSTGFGADLQFYWRLEFEALGEIDESFLVRIDERMERTSEGHSLLRALRAEALERLGRTDEARAEIRIAWRDALLESESDAAVRGHLDLIRERLVRITGDAPPEWSR
jgi:tetratricopeptide (TPR) repeat protein